MTSGISPAVLTIGGWSITWFGVLVLAGALLVRFFMGRQMKRNGYSEDTVDTLWLGILAFGILGARLWYVLFKDPAYYFSHPAAILQIWRGGMAIHGGILGGGLFACWYCRKHRMSVLRVTDAVFPYVLLAQAIGRWGNFFSKESYGPAVEESWFRFLPSFIREGMFIDGEYRMPLFLWSSVLDLIGFWMIMKMKDSPSTRRGDLTWGYFLWYGAMRFWIEQARTDALLAGNFRVAQIVSAVFMIAGFLGLAGVYRKKGKPARPVLLFDNDGTLVDSAPAIKASARYALKKYRPDYEPREEELDAFVGPPLEESFAKYVPKEQVPECVACYKERNKEDLKSVKPMPHVMECLKKWHEEGYLMGIVSTKYQDVVCRGLDYAGIPREYFGVILGGDQVKEAKPSPEGIYAACRKLKASQDDVVYAGDSVSDVQAAKNAGVYSVGYVSSPYRKKAMEDSRPNCLTEDFRKIDEVLKEDISWTSDLK